MTPTRLYITDASEVMTPTLCVALRFVANTWQYKYQGLCTTCCFPLVYSNFINFVYVPARAALLPAALATSSADLVTVAFLLTCTHTQLWLSDCALYAEL